MSTVLRPPPARQRIPAAGLPRRPAAPPGPAHGRARWLTRPDSSGRGELVLAVETKAGLVERLYHTEAVIDAGEIVGWQLTRASDPGKVYHIDTRTGTADWLCDCGDCVFRNRRCKHAGGLAAALEKIGWGV
jgi:hypothetical protein